MVSQKVYDEDAILKKFHPLLNKKNIAFQKHYLHREVCKAIVEYDNRDSSSQEIFHQILLIRIYRKKGLLDEAHALWKKAVLKARQTESFAFINLLKTEFEKMILFSNVHTSYDELHSIFKEHIISYDEYAEMITLRDIYAETLLLKRKAHFDLDEDHKAAISVLLHRINKTKAPVHNPSFWFRHYYRMNKATLLYLLNDIPGSWVLLRETFDDWKLHSQYLQTHGEYYIELMYMINYVGILRGSYNYVVDAFHDKRNDQILDPSQRANFEVIKFLALNKIYNKTARYDEVEKLVQFMKVKYRQWELLLNSDLNRTANLSLGIACFVLEQYDDALYFTKRAITYFKDGTREEQVAVANILLLLITYNLNNAKLFDSQYKATYTYFYNRQKKHPFETSLVQCLHRTFYMKENKEKTAAYQKTLKLLEENKDDNVQQMAFSIFNYPGWLSSKVQRISYRDYVARKVKAEAKVLV